MRIVPRAQVEEAWREHREEKLARLARQKARERTFINFDLALTPVRDRFFFFRGRKYGVPPIPWRLAGEIADTWDRFSALEPGTPQGEVVHLVEQIVALFRRTAYPARLRHRLTYRLRNPFRAATFVELREIHAFFLTCAINDQGLSGSTGDALHPQIWQTSLSDSPGSAPHGQTNGDSPSPGSTSSSGDAQAGSTVPKTRSGSPVLRGLPKRPRKGGRTGRGRSASSSGGADE